MNFTTDGINCADIKMCVNPRGICASFISIITCFGSEEKPQIAYLNILPVEILDKIFLYLDYASISRLRAVSVKMNSICARCLNRAFFRIITDIADYIFTSYLKLNITGKDVAEILQMYGRQDEAQRCNFQLVLKEIHFASMCFFILINLREKILTFTVYKDTYYDDETDFVFIYGNCIDWARDQLRHLKHHRVTLNDKDALRAPLRATQHALGIISFYEKKNCSYFSSIADILYLVSYAGSRRGVCLESGDESRVKSTARQVKILLKEICTDF